MNLSDRSSLSVIPEFVWRKVLLKGTWDHAHTMILSPRVREGVHGVHIITPLVRENGSTILVNRGFVSNEQLESGAYLKDVGEIEIIGMLNTSQKKNAFTPENQPSEGKWYWMDVDAMAGFAGGEEAGVQPVLVEQIFGELKHSSTRSSKADQVLKRDMLEKLLHSLIGVFQLVDLPPSS